jgi:hypothetical protein
LEDEPMSRHDDEVPRLYGPAYIDGLHKKIAQLEAELAGRRRGFDEILSQLSDQQRIDFEERDNALKRVEQLEAENKRLREGMRKFSNSIGYDNGPEDGYAVVDPQDWAEFDALTEPADG